MSAALRWIAGSDTGSSSKAIWRHMMTGDAVEDRWGASYPHDPDDFGRCYRLLELMPDWRPRMVEMVKYNAEWRALVGAWDELTVMYAQAIAANQKYARPMYDRMHALLSATRVCTNCGDVGITSYTRGLGDEKTCSKCCAERGT